MPLKCQLSVWACIALDMKYSSTHTETAVGLRCYTERNKIWSLHFPFPWRPCALIICQSDRCFSNDGVSCVLNFHQSPTVRDCGTLCTIWCWNPPWTQSLVCEAPCRQVSQRRGERRGGGRGVGGGCQGGLLRWWSLCAHRPSALTRAWLTVDKNAGVRQNSGGNLFFVAATNIIYCTDININIDGKQTRVTAGPQRYWELRWKWGRVHLTRNEQAVVFYLPDWTDESFLRLFSNFIYRTKHKKKNCFFVLDIIVKPHVKNRQPSYMSIKIKVI